MMVTLLPVAGGRCMASTLMVSFSLDQPAAAAGATRASMARLVRIMPA
jgi:hypothetical protein